ncbi:protein lin-37 homolog [Dryobates pubescens]|uniref:protein lin-37 homolog n=1 Tax=Dryobates pubescens TaxID=118200 RepID=UPI0023B96B9C|nr:protein lin-37 homolog [Dryobates pubescens]
MLAVKVKVEKPDLEAASARSRLDAVLQELLERREPLEEEVGKTAGEAHSKEASPSAPGKRPAARLSQQRRKKRREAEEGPEPGLQRHNSYVIKLFDRSVELGQFPEGTPLYPVCRAWMRNCPTAQSPPAPQVTPPRPEVSSTSHLQTYNLKVLHTDSQAYKCPISDPCAPVHAGKVADIYELPPPAPPGPPRIPSPLGPEVGNQEGELGPDPPPSMASLIYSNMERWKRVRQRWQEAAQRQQQRYGPSLRLLRLIYERQ